VERIDDNKMAHISSIIELYHIFLTYPTAYGKFRIMKTKILPLFLLSLLFFSCGKEPTDPLVEWFEKENLLYQKDPDGDYRVLLKVNERTQYVWIYSNSHTMGDVSIREIFSPAYLMEEGDNRYILEQLLLDNYTHSLWGYWGMAREGDHHLLIYQMQIPESDFYTLLEEALYTVALQADRLEERMNSGMDQF